MTRVALVNPPWSFEGSIYSGCREPHLPIESDPQFADLIAHGAASRYADFKRRLLEGAARRGAPARAKVVDQYGQAHFVMIEPHHDGDVITSGATALLVRREGKLFYALPDAPSLLSTTSN